jgi:hypothetical protein
MGQGNRTGEKAKADLRRPITAWRALVWAYRDECVRAASNVEADRYARTDAASVPMTRERVSGGLINGFLAAHEDALLIDAKLIEWFDNDSRRLIRTIRAAERAKPPPGEIVVPLARPYPMYNRDGSIATELKKSNGKWQPYLCILDWQGEPAHVVAKRLAEYAEFHALFLAFLDAMTGFRLSLWRVEGRGLT